MQTVELGISFDQAGSEIIFYSRILLFSRASLECHPGNLEIEVASRVRDFIGAKGPREPGGHRGKTAGQWVEVLLLQLETQV